MMVYIREHDHSEGSLWANNGDVRPCRYKLLGQSLPPRLQRAIKCDQVISVANQTVDRYIHPERRAASRIQPALSPRAGPPVGR